jgi:hypothetical protein
MVSILSATNPTTEERGDVKSTARRDPTLEMREAVIERVLANPPPYGVLDEAYRIWLRKLIVPSGEG